MDDREQVLISAIEHYSYCPRQCALIHVEQTFDENLYTIRGKIVHERVDVPSDVRNEEVRIARSLPLWSDRLDLSGRADLVEFRPEGPYPVEHKLGSASSPHAALQLCAQALCLEEMTGREVPRGALFLWNVRERQEVELDSGLRDRTIAVIERIRELLAARSMPEAVNDARCPNCSLVYSCLPQVVGDRARMRGIRGSLWRPLTLGPDG